MLGKPGLLWASHASDKDDPREKTKTSSLVIYVWRCLGTEADMKVSAEFEG